MNSLEKASTMMSDKGYEVGSLEDIPQRDRYRMNERVQEIARQAGAQHRLNLGVEEFCFEHHELQKFAELIVRECAKVAVEAEFTGVARLIMIHFGIEE